MRTLPPGEPEEHPQSFSLPRASHTEELRKPQDQAEDREDPNYVMGHKVTWPQELKAREMKMNAAERTTGAPGKGQGGRTERKSRKERAANK